MWWACRTLWHLNTAALYLGNWQQSLEYCRRALAHGRAVNDLRLQVAGLWRTGATHVFRGDPHEGFRWFEESLALSPAPFDDAMVRMARGYGLVRAGDVATGTAELAEALVWFERSRLSFTRTMTALRLSEGQLMQGERPRARALLEEVRATSRQLGYGYFEGVAERLLGESFLPDDPARASGHVETAMRILREIGAQNELAKTLMSHAEIMRSRGECGQARQLLEQASEIFEAIGTLDEPARVRAALATLSGSLPR